MKIDNKITEFKLSYFILTWGLFWGIAFHLYPIYKVDFPIGDGGMFYVMVRDVQIINFHLPKYTTYNGNNIPFIYPPLPFFLYGIINLLTNIPILILFKWLPTITFIICTIFFFILSRIILKSYLLASISVLGFALHPTFFSRIIMGGGGITRSLGLLFSIISLIFYYQLFTQRKWKFILFSSIFGSLIILSHPEWSLQTFGIIFLIWLLNKPNLNTLLLGLITILLIILFISPWWIIILKYHGINPILYAFNSGYKNYANIFSLLMLTFSEYMYFPIFSALAILGFLYNIIKRSFLLPLSIIIPFIIDPRIAPQIIIIPLCMLFSIGIVNIILLLPIWIKNNVYIEFNHKNNETLNLIWNNKYSKFILGYILTYLLLVSFAKSIIVSKNYLPNTVRESFNWIMNNIPSKSKFYLITGDYGFEDIIKEWFPALTNSYSINTIQGTEWLNDFYNKLSYSYPFNSCDSKDTLCLYIVIEQSIKNCDYIYLYTEDNLQTGNDPCIYFKLHEYFNNKDKFELIYDKNSIIIYKILSK